MEETKKLGAFEITPITEDNEIVAYNIKSMSGNFELKVDKTTALGIVLGLDYQGVEDNIDFWIHMIYQLTQIVPDLEFVEGFTRLVVAQAKRWDMVKEKPEPIDDVVDEADAVNAVMINEIGKNELNEALDNATLAIDVAQEMVNNATD